MGMNNIERLRAELDRTKAELAQEETISSVADLNRLVAKHVMGWKSDGGGWQFIGFATDPAASYALEEQMIKRGFALAMATNVDPEGLFWMVRFQDGGKQRGYKSGSRLTAMCLAALRALNVEFELAEGWYQR